MNFIRRILLRKASLLLSTEGRRTQRERERSKLNELRAGLGWEPIP